MDTKVDWAERVAFEQAEVDHCRGELRKMMSRRNNPRATALTARLRSAERRLATARTRAERAEV